jgi:imidazolonepropionase-like amidohydrolase
MITAESDQEIREALDLADEFRLRAILVGASEAWKVVDLIKSKNVPVVLARVMDPPRKEEDPYDANYSTPAALSNAGIRFAFTTAGAATVRDLPFIAAIARAFGLSAEESLKAVTLYPAQILNLDKELGSISVGKLGNIMITDGDPLEPLTTLSIGNTLVACLSSPRRPRPSG